MADEPVANVDFESTAGEGNSRHEPAFGLVPDSNLWTRYRRIKYGFAL